MKKIFFLITILLIINVNYSYSQSQADFSLARISKLNNKLVFLMSEPVNEYDIAFTFVNTIENMDCLSPEQVCLESIKNANIEAVNQGKLYDAIVTVDGSDRDIAVVWKDKSKDNGIARVKRNEGKYVFVQCEPLNNYNIIGKYNVSGVGQQLLLGTCPTHQQKIEKILKKSNKDKLDFDAVIYGSSTNDIAIKFNR